MNKLPENYKESMKQLLQEEYEDYLNSFQEEPTVSIRINESKISVEDFLKISPFKLKPIPWIHNGFYVLEGRPGKHPFYDAGLYYVQEASAMTPAEALPIKKGDRVLDCCAAPGGKSDELLNKLQGTGFFLTNDISASRAYTMLKNLQRNGHENMVVTAEDTNHLAALFPNFFDKILVDAPCSGEGMFRKDDGLIKSWMEKGNDYYAPIQKEILQSAWKMLKKGGKLLYSTCTFSPSEDEEVIQNLLETNKDAKVIPISIKQEGFVPGNPYTQAIRLYPHKIKGEGHFLCLLEKEGESTNDHPSISCSSKLPSQASEFFSKIHHSFENGHFVLIQEKLYYQSNVDLPKMRILCGGLYCGDCLKGRFEPSQAFAMALKKEEFDQVLDLDLDDIRTEKYLRGETIELDKPAKGYFLVCVKGYPIGFGKANGIQLKNKLEKGWIRS